MAILCKWPILFCGLYLSTCLSSLSFIVFYIYFVCWCISLCGWHHTFSFLLSFFSFIKRDLCMLSLSVVSDSLDPMGWRPPGISVHGILQASILEWVAISFSRGSSQPRDRNCVSCLAGRFFTTEPPRKPQKFLNPGQIPFASWMNQSI